MKKFRMLFSTIAVVAIVSSALAFTKARQHADVFCNDGSNHCTLAVQFQFEPNGVTQSNPCTSGSYGTFDSANPCSSTAPIYNAIDE